MSDKKEITTLSIKISVDSTDLDKLEAQLKRIEGLMVSTGLKQPAKGGFITDFVAFNHFGCLEPVFTNSTDRAFINGVFIDNASLEKVMTQAAKEGAKKGLEQARFEITTGINDNREQVSAVAILKSSAEISRKSEVISREQSEFEKFEQQVEFEFSQLQAQINGIQCASAASDQSTAQYLSDLQCQVTELGKEIEEVRLKGSLDAINIISIKQTMEQQEKLMIQTIKSVIAEDIAQGGPLYRAIR